MLGLGVGRAWESAFLRNSQMDHTTSSTEVKVAQSCLTLCNQTSPGQNTGVGGLSLLQGIFPTQGSNPGLPHCRWILYQLSPGNMVSGVKQAGITSDLNHLLLYIFGHLSLNCCRTFICNARTIIFILQNCGESWVQRCIQSAWRRVRQEIDSIPSPFWLPSLPPLFPHILGTALLWDTRSHQVSLPSSLHSLMWSTPGFNP